MRDVLVLGAGLAGLSCARDLMRGGADVQVLEARPRVGGRVEQEVLPDGRVLQHGGEVVGAFHTAYIELVKELGMQLVPSYMSEPGEMTWDLVEGVFLGDEPPWQSGEDRADSKRVESLFHDLCRGVNPDDPWSHPDAARLDHLSVAGWMREVEARPAVIRAFEVGQLGLAADSFERTSLLSELRKQAAAGVGEGKEAPSGLYDLDQWESMRVATGSASVALRMGEELGERVRLGSVVERVDVAAGGCRVTLRGGEVLEADAVVSAMPVGPLRQVAISGVSEARLGSLRRQRHALAAKVVVAYPEPFWRKREADGLAECEGFFGSTWPQSEGVLSILVPPERFAAYLATPEPSRREAVMEQLERLYGEEARQPDAYRTREWGVDPFTLGYITSWAPGDVMKVGPLHGTHEPPFYVCGSDQWVAGYMEGAVRTGRGAARAALNGTAAAGAKPAGG